MYCSPWGHKELNTTELISICITDSLLCIAENGIVNQLYSNKKLKNKADQKYNWTSSILNHKKNQTEFLSNTLLNSPRNSIRIGKSEHAAHIFNILGTGNSEKLTANHIVLITYSHAILCAWLVSQKNKGNQ